MKATCLVCGKENESPTDAVKPLKIGAQGVNVCPLCLRKCKIGGMVLGMPEEHGIFLNHNDHALYHQNGEKRVWACGFGKIRSLRGPFWGDTPEAALEAAGVKEGEG